MDEILLVAPTNLVAEQTDSTQVTLTWDYVDGAISYNVYRATQDEQTAFVKIGETQTNTYVDSGLTPNTKYYYRVTFVSQDQVESEQSTTLTVTTLDDNIPSPPEDITVGLVTCSTIQLIYSESENADRYNIYNVTDTTTTLLLTTTSTNVVLRNLLENQTYNLEVTAVNQEGESEPTTIAVTTLENCSNTCVNTYVYKLKCINGVLYRCYVLKCGRCCCL